jgi:hypothetical protein
MALLNIAVYHPLLTGRWKICVALNMPKAFTSHHSTFVINTELGYFELNNSTSVKYVSYLLNISADKT